MTKYLIIAAIVMAIVTVIPEVTNVASKTNMLIF